MNEKGYKLQMPLIDEEEKHRLTGGIMDISYKFYDEENVVLKINSLEEILNNVINDVGTEQDIYFEDLFISSAVDKSLKLIDSFLFALKARNITVLAILTRVQMDCVLRTFATTLVDDSGEFCKKVLCDGIQINRMQGSNGKYLTDRYLCECFGEYIDLPIYELYEKVCGYVHFSESSFHNSVRPEEKDGFTMKISKENQIEYEKVYSRLSLELANHFFYFGRLLIDVVFRSWLEQKIKYKV